MCVYTYTQICSYFGYLHMRRQYYIVFIKLCSTLKADIYTARENHWLAFRKKLK